MNYKKSWMTSSVIIVTTTACLLQNPGNPVHLLPHDFTRYWSQLEQQWPRWFVSQCLNVPKLPDREVLRARIRFFEVPWNVMQREGNYCTYSGWKIRVGTGQWACVPHELGHAACDFLDPRPEGCEDYEHLKPQNCIEEV